MNAAGLLNFYKNPLKEKVAQIAAQSYYDIKKFNNWVKRAVHFKSCSFFENNWFK